MEDVKVGRAVIWFIDCLIRLFRLPLIFPPISAILKPAKQHQSPIISSLVDQLANFRNWEWNLLALEVLIPLKELSSLTISTIGYYLFLFCIHLKFPLKEKQTMISRDLRHCNYILYFPIKLFSGHTSSRILDTVGLFLSEWGRSTGQTGPWKINNKQELFELGVCGYLAQNDQKYIFSAKFGRFWAKNPIFGGRE